MGESEEAEAAAPTATAAAAMDSSAVAAEEASYESFHCFVCLDLLYKPIVLACGHISCFWCVHKAMDGVRVSRCAICRQPYKYFPSICQLLHHLLLKIEPVAYKRRENEVLEEEKKANCFSPQFVDCLTTEMSHANENDSVALAELLKSDALLHNNIPGIEKVDGWHSKVDRNITIEESRLPERSFENGICNQVEVSDVLCARCKQLLIRPTVLNCGHVYCESCMANLVSETPRCQVCQSLHPGGLPKVCLEIDHFLEKQFPKEYALRRESLQPKQVEYQNGSPSGGLQTDKHESKSASDQIKHGLLWLLNEDLSNAHVGVGCDTCGMYPIMGKRYKCKDCKEAVGFDLCEACYNSSSKLPGRFNQQHTPDHTFVLDDSLMLRKILRPESPLPNQGGHRDLPDGDPEEPENPDSTFSYC